MKRGSKNSGADVVQIIIFYMISVCDVCKCILQWQVFHPSYYRLTGHLFMLGKISQFKCMYAIIN